MKDRTIIAIDPGEKGGIAIWPESAKSPAAFKMPETEGDILELLKSNSDPFKPPIAVVEQVGGYTGGLGAPGSAMFNFGRNFGYILGVLQALEYRIELVRPQEWQKTFSLGTSGVNKTMTSREKSKAKTAWKNKLKEKAQQLNPHLKVTLQTADALLLLDYGRKLP